MRVGGGLLEMKMTARVERTIKGKEDRGRKQREGLDEGLLWWKTNRMRDRKKEGEMLRWTKRKMEP